MDKREEAELYVKTNIDNKKETQLLINMKTLGSQIDKLLVGIKNVYDELLKYKHSNDDVRAFYEDAVQKRPRTVTMAAAFEVNRLFQEKKRSNSDNAYLREKYAKLSEEWN